jgi:Tfp pilus assembly protein PilW
MKTTPTTPSCRRAGFTLAEMMVAASISVLVVLGLVRMFTQQRIAHQAMQQLNDVSQSVRTALDMVACDIRNAGYGSPRGSYSSWITWVSGITGAVTVVQGSGTSSDIIHIMGAFDPPCAYLSATSGLTSITLQSGQATNFNTTDRKIICIGHTECARIVSIAGDTLTVSSSPTSVNSLKFRYGVGASVELVKVITYSWGDGSSTYPHTQYLKRWDNVTSFDAEWKKMAASNIEDFQISGTNKVYTISLTGRTAKKDLMYVHPVKNDNYRRVTYSVQAAVRQP